MILTHQWFVWNIYHGMTARVLAVKTECRLSFVSTGSFGCHSDSRAHRVRAVTYYVHTTYIHLSERVLWRHAFPKGAFAPFYATCLSLHSCCCSTRQACTPPSPAVLVLHEPSYHNACLNKHLVCKMSWTDTFIKGQQGVKFHSCSFTQWS